MIARVTCEPQKRVNRVVYTMFKTPALASRDYAKDRKAADVDADTDSDCAALSDSESPYRTGAGRSGRVFCSTAHGHHISWTDHRVVATATGRDDQAIYDWWANLVGRTLDADQQALLAEVPNGIDPLLCADNGPASIKCGYVADDVYGLRYTRYPDAASLSRAYASLVDEHDVVSNTPPSLSVFGSCNYETNWGPVDSNGVVTVEKGRGACYEDDFLPTLLWTYDEHLTLVEAVGGTTGALGAFFESYANAPANPTGV